MAYPTVCSACLGGRHSDCEKSSKEKLPPEMIGGWICVCAHDGPETTFQREVRLRAEANVKGE